MNETFYVYVLSNPSGQLYIGQTNNLNDRVARHNQGKSKWTRSRGPWELVYSETFVTRFDAIKRERFLKSGRLNQNLHRKLNGRVGPSAEG